jgi:hypothetical protein
MRKEVIDMKTMEEKAEDLKFQITMLEMKAKMIDTKREALSAQLSELEAKIESKRDKRLGPVNELGYREILDES